MNSRCGSKSTEDSVEQLTAVRANYAEHRTRSIEVTLQQDTTLPLNPDWMHFVLTAIEDHERVLRHCARRWLRSPDLVDDVVQHAFRQLCESQSRGNPPRRVRYWLLAVVEHHAACIRRGLAIGGDDGREGVLLSVASGTGDPVDAYADKELRLGISRAMNLLSERSRVVVEMRLDGKSVAEIADALGISKQTVKWRFSKSLDRMRGSLRSYRTVGD